MEDQKSGVYLALCIIAALMAAFLVFHAFSRAATAQDASVINIGASPKDSLAVILYNHKEKPARRTVKGIYLTAYSAGIPKKIDSMIDLIDRTELNSVIIDIKDYSGAVLYDRIGDVQALIKKLHDHNIYVIARQTVFQDPWLAEQKPEWAIRSKRGGSASPADKLWHDKKGLTWVDPTRKEVWEYNVKIAKEAIRLGFDEINFDYVRFPSDGDMGDVVYTVGDKKRYEIMGEFYHFLSTELADEPVWISLDMFGFSMEKHGEDDMRIGQRIADAVNETDYIAPMMYPSHYPAGHLGFANPAEHPADVIEHGMKLGAPKFTDARAQVRPWIQAFNIGANYTGASSTLIRAQIDMVEKYSDAGWMLWNAANRYTEVGLRIE